MGDTYDQTKKTFLVTDISAYRRTAFRAASRCRLSPTGQTFQLSIDQHTVDQAMPGEFNAYGLSTSASLPQF